MTNYFFDLDGTLTDPKVGITTCVQYALGKLDEPVPSNDELEWCIGPPLYDNFVQLVGEGRAADGVLYYRERFADVGLFENEVYQGIGELLGLLKINGHSLYVASSKPKIFVDRILEKFELIDYFEMTFGSELDGTRADKSKLLAYALQQSGIAANTQLNKSGMPDSTAAVAATMIGDRKHDIIGAANNGLASIGVLYGYGSREELTNISQELGQEIVLAESPSQLHSILSLQA